jgi:hypothetical protein
VFFASRSFCRHFHLLWRGKVPSPQTVPVSAGAAKYTTSTLATGTHNITATYNGSTDFAGSSGALVQTVN